MPFSALSAADVDSYPDLQSVPKLRRITNNPQINLLARAVSFDFISVSGLDVDNFRFGEGLSSDTNYPTAFIDTYIAEKLGAIDPFLKAARNATKTVIEAEVYAIEEPPQRLAYLARTFGVHNRTMFPVRRGDITYGAITLARQTPFEAEEIAFMETVAEAIHTATTEPLRERLMVDHLRLTKGELACLSQASLGLTSEQIAKATGYQTETVNSYIKVATRKLGVANRTHAIAEAIRRRLIT